MKCNITADRSQVESAQIKEGDLSAAGLNHNYHPGVPPAILLANGIEKTGLGVLPLPGEPDPGDHPDALQRANLESFCLNDLADYIGNLPVVLEADGHLLQGEKCLCPFHEDRTPSFSLKEFEDGSLRFKCFGCDAGGDLFAYVMRRDGIGFAQAIKWVIDQGVAGSIAGKPTRQRTEAKKKAKGQPRRLPHLYPGDESDFKKLAELRKLSIDGIASAAEAGVLLFCSVDDIYGYTDPTQSWAVTDSTERNLQLRKLNGQLWQCLGGKKARTWTGCRASWPIGLAQAGDKILLLEGGPDLLSGFHFIHHFGADGWSPVAMLGASLNIQKEDLPFFKGKHVRIVPHLDLDKDRVGQKAAARWAEQLKGTAREVDRFLLEGLRMADGKMIGDLNDCTSIHPKEAAELEGLFS